jgi:putative ABC transport system permease protein
MPDWESAISQRLGPANLDPVREAEVVEELSQHLDDRYQELRANGVSDAEARRRALEELKDSDLLARELARSARPIAPPSLGTLPESSGYFYGFLHDLKIACRNLRFKPAFSLMVIGMLGLGIAGNAAIFSIFNALFLRPLPFPEAERLIDVDETAPKWNLKYVGTANPDFFQWQKANTTFDGLAFYTNGSANLSDKDSAQRVRAAQVTYTLMDVLGIKPVLGRNFLPEEDRPKATKVVLLGHDLWQRLFQGDRNVLGRTLKLDEETYSIVGVLPREAVIPDQAELWVPLAGDPKDSGGWYLSGIGRLKRGISPEQALADLTRVHKAEIPKGRTVNEITSPILTPLRDRALGDFRTVSRILLGAVSVVLLIACVNVAALMLVRGSMRAKEIAIRTAMGASRGRIIRQLLSEGLVLAVAGGVVGVLVGDLFLRAMVSLMPKDNLPRWITFELDGRFALFCVAITGAAAILFALAPSIQASRVDPRGSLQDNGSRTTLSRAKRATLGAFVVFEVALALLLTISSGLLVQAFRKVLQVDPGFRPEHVLTYRVTLPQATYKKPELANAFFDRLTERLRAVPGVQAVGLATAPPLGGHWGNFFVAEGDKPLGPNEKEPVVLQIVASPGYFDAIGMTFVGGRPFNERDGESKDAPVAIVNESFAKAHWGHASALGKRIRYHDPKSHWMEIIGVTKDEKHYGLDQEMRPSVFMPLRQISRNSLAVVMRGSIDPQSLVAPAREILRQMDPGLPMFAVRTMSEQLNRSLWARRAYSWLFGAFSTIALLMAAAGLYGVVSYAVTQRTQEIGIRMALGARPEQVLRHVLAGGMVLVAIGLSAGLAGALAGGQLLKTMLFGVSPRDPMIYAAVISGVICIGLLANFVPARRAASVDPIRALRFE